MSLARPVVSVYSCAEEDRVTKTSVMPTVFTSPLRPDLVRFIHTNMSKNNRQAYAVAPNAGYQTSAESWGTGRAVARIPRVPGGGTHRAGQGAFGNMCRGGGMFSPTKVWRRWHRKVNITQKRHALASAIAASSIPSLVMARGHRLGAVPEMPLVCDDSFQNVEKTKQALDVLKKLGCEEDVEKVANARKIRAGKGKHRNRRYVLRRGPLIVYSEDNGISKAVRNIGGVDACHVDRLNLLQFAPGGSLGRFVVWTESAFKKLEAIYGNYRSGAPAKKGYVLPRPMMTNADLARIINSEEVQSVIRPKKEGPRHRTQRKNPLTNHAVMCRLNPAAKMIKRQGQLAQDKTSAVKKMIEKRKAKAKAETCTYKKGVRGYKKDLKRAFLDKSKAVLDAAYQKKVALAAIAAGQI